MSNITDTPFLQPNVHSLVHICMYLHGNDVIWLIQIRRTSWLDISIHSSHEGRYLVQKIIIITCHISIHSSHEGRYENLELAFQRVLQFQSTHPAKGGTWQIWHWLHCSIISIHSSHKGRYQVLADVNAMLNIFQSTHPAKGDTAILHKNLLSYSYSIAKNSTVFFICCPKNSQNSQN